MSGNDKGSWFDDPDWVELQQRVNGQHVHKPSRAELKAEQKRQQQEREARERAAAQKLEAEARARGDTPAEPKKVNVSVNLTLPRVNVKKITNKAQAGLSRVTPRPVKKQLAKRSNKQLMIGSAGLILLVIAVIGMFSLLSGKSQKNDGTDKGVLAQQTVKIDFKPLLPNGKTDETTAYKAAEDGQGRPIYTFTDKIGSVDITVSEQPLPEKLKANTEGEMDKMAKDLYLTEVINASNPKAYLGTNVKGPQTVIFTKNGLLVFIQSQGKIDKDQWSDYVTRLIP